MLELEDVVFAWCFILGFMSVLIVIEPFVFFLSVSVLMGILKVLVPMFFLAVLAMFLVAVLAWFYCYVW